MKKLLVSTLAAVIACPAFAGEMHKADSMQSSNMHTADMHQEKASLWNMWNMDAYMAVGAGASYTNLNFDFADDKESIDSMVYQGHVALGLEVSKTARMELELSMFSDAKKTKDFGSVKDVEVKAQMTDLLFNTYMEFGHYKTIRPFVGLGAGIAFVDLSRDIAGYTEDKSETKFAAMGALGLTFDMQRYAIDVAARYNYVDVESGLHNFGGDVAIRFMF